MSTAWKGMAALLALVGCVAAPAANAVCRDNVVLVHGNAGYPSDFDNTYDELIYRGYTASQIWRPDWGSKSCPACNDHNGSEQTPVNNAINAAIAASCTGKIDVIGHSMGATLAGKSIVDLAKASKVDAFVGIAGAMRGLWSCGQYPYNVANSTCGYWGLSVGSPFLNWLYGKSFGARRYSIKSWSDEVICYGGVCTVGGVHSSQIWSENASYTFALGHWGLLLYTPITQVDLIQ